MTTVVGIVHVVHVMRPGKNKKPSILRTMEKSTMFRWDVVA